MNNKIISKIAELVEENSENVALSSVLNDFDAWDSLAKVSFLVFASTEYGVQLGGGDFEKASTVNDLCSLIMEKKNENSN